MDSNDHGLDDDAPLPIRDRTDSGGGWSRAWPLLALALIGLMLVRACMAPPGPPSAPSAPSAPSVPSVHSVPSAPTMAPASR